MRLQLSASLAFKGEGRALAVAQGNHMLCELIEACDHVLALHGYDVNRVNPDAPREVPNSLSIELEY